MRRQLAALGFALVTLVAVPAAAQHGRDVPPPPQAGSASGMNPTAAAPGEQQLLQELNKLQGRVSIPDSKAAVLEQPQGRGYQSFHERYLPWIGGLLIIAVLLGLALFYAMRGRIRTEAPETGIKIRRFNAFERLVHWMTAASFIVLGLTGLNYVFGKRLIFPLIGPDAFAAWSQWAKFAHNFIAWPFIIGIVLMLLIWIRDNIPDRYDWPWLRQGGGMFGRGHPPARRFNAGQKLMFWSVILGGGALSVSGILMLFPFWSLDINGMQWAQYVHAFTGVIMIAIILGHIYIGTLGMEGAYDAMGSGEVDLAWAREHHSAWVDEQQARDPRAGPHTVPAE
jgi:formate dehydrogenase subunit gamma